MTDSLTKEDLKYLQVSDLVLLATDLGDKDSA